MAYTINKFNGQPLITLQDASIDASTSLKFVGRSYVGYGEIQNENFLHLMESFANDAPPPRPLDGQLWFDTSTNTLNVYNGNNWSPVSAASPTVTPPENPSLGSLWFNSANKTLNVWNGVDWTLVGPETVEGFGITRARSTTLVDSNGNLNPVILLTADDIVVAIVSSKAFTISQTPGIPGFVNLSAGITVSSALGLRGNLDGTASQAGRLQNTRTINGVGFNGTANIEIKAPTIGRLLPGDYITGNNFDGSVDQTWSIDATSANSIGKIVARNSQGGFAAGTITADLVGNVTSPQGTSKFDVIEANRFIGAVLTGNADSATRLRTKRKINGVDFDGTQDITVTASATTLSGSFLNSNVKNSALEQVGTLNNLNVQNAGIAIGSSSQLQLVFQDTESVINSTTTLKLLVNDGPSLMLVSSSGALLLGSEDSQPIPAIISDNPANLGLPTKKFKTVYAEVFEGTATKARYADLAENYSSDAEYEPGTVLEFGGEFEVTLAEESTQRVAGIVSSNPAHLMNSNCKGKYVVALALQGKVPCKVKGTVKKGDILVSAGGGFARSCAKPLIGTIIGKSLEDFNGIDGVVEVAAGRI